jgi:hypothetical protein
VVSRSSFSPRPSWSRGYAWADD